LRPPPRHRGIAAWLLLGAAAWLLLPWYFQQDLPLLKALGGVFGGPDTASGAVQALRHGQPWLAIVPLALALAAVGWVLPAGRAQGRWLLAGGALGVAGLLASGFGIGAQGWAWAWLQALFGALPRGQFGIGLGSALALLALLALLMLAGAGIARLGAFKGDVFVAGAVLLCSALLLLFVALPVSRSSVGAFLGEDGGFSATMLGERLGNERVWGLGCLGIGAEGGTRCGVAWNTLLLALLTAVGTTVMGTLIALYAELGNARLKKPLNVLALVPIITPPFVVGLGLILLFGRAGLLTRRWRRCSASCPRAGSTASSACGWRRCSPSRPSPS